MNPLYNDSCYQNCSKASVIHALDGSTSNFLKTANSIYSKIFGNKQCRYNEGPLYFFQGWGQGKKHDLFPFVIMKKLCDHHTS